MDVPRTIVMSDEEITVTDHGFGRQNREDEDLRASLVINKQYP